MEVTKWLKPLVSVSRIGDSASVQAVTRVNAEQALYGVCQEVFSGTTHLFSFIGFFVRSQSSFLRPRARFAHGGARRGPSRLAVAPTFPDAPPWPGHT